MNARDFSNHEDVFDLDSLPQISPPLSGAPLQYLHDSSLAAGAENGFGVAAITVHPQPQYKPPQIERPLPVQVIDGHAFVTDAATLAQTEGMATSFEEESDESPPYLPVTRTESTSQFPKRSPTEEEYHQTVINHAV